MDCRKVNAYSAIVFDFDGTMIELFKNFNLNSTVRKLHFMMQNYGIEYAINQDAFDVFDEIIKQTEDNYEIRERALCSANELLSNAEMEAVNSGKLVDGIVQAISVLQQRKIPIGVATNNSAICVENFMEKYCSGISIPIVGRIGTRPELMKPCVWSLEEVSKQLGCSMKDVLFIGDTKRDYLCAQNAECMFLGMAPTEKKRVRLLQIIDETEIFSTYGELLARLGL